MDRQKLLIRPVSENDLIPLCDIASRVGAGLVSLPADQNIIREKIKRSIDSFAGENAIEARLFLFVLEDLEKNKIIATSAIEARSGTLWTFYSYFVTYLVQQYHSSKSPEIFAREQRNKVLYLSNDYQETSLLCTLYVDPGYRSLGLGSLMSRIRYVFMAEFPDSFSEKIIAEMRGVFDEQNRFPFWEGLGRHFYQMSLLEAEKLLSLEGSQIISDLNPRLPIYVDLLPVDAKAAIAEVNQGTKPDLHVLEKEGFVYQNHIDVFDGGPIIEARRKDIRTVKLSQTAIVLGLIQNFEQNRDSVENMLYMVSNAKLDFRACLAQVEWHNGNEVYLENHVMQLLGLSLGDRIRLCAFRYAQAAH